MSQNTVGSSRPAKSRFVIQSKWFSILLLAVFVVLRPCPAIAQDEEYMRIFDMIQQADSLDTTQQAAAAIAKYRAAQIDLRNFQRNYPSWNPNIVTFRMNYLSDKLATLTEQKAPAETNAPAPPPSPAHTAHKAATSVSDVTLKLLDAGSEPRKVLRFHPAAGSKETLEMVLKMSMAMKMGEGESSPIKMPPMNLSMETTVKDVSADGDITYDLAMGDATIGDAPGVMPQVAASMKSSLNGLKAISGTGVITSRGLNKGTTIKMQPGADPQLSQMMDQMKDSFSRLSAPLPEEAVGPGARWEVKMPIKSQGLTIDQSAVYELVSIDGDRITAKSSITQRAVNQKISNPAMPNLKIDLVKMAGSGSGNVTFDLGQLLPPKGTMDIHTDMTMGMNVGNQKQTMSMQMDMNLLLEAK